MNFWPCFAHASHRTSQSLAFSLSRFLVMPDCRSFVRSRPYRQMMNCVFIYMHQLPRLQEQNVVVWDPLLVSSAFSHHHIPRLPFDSQTSQFVTVITVVLVNSHWIPIIWRKDQHHLLGFVANASDIQLLAPQDERPFVRGMEPSVAYDDLLSDLPQRSRSVLGDVEAP